MKVYITNYNAKIMINAIRLIDGIDIDENEEIYKINFKWFNRHETKNLLTFKLLVQNPNEFFKKYERKEVIDTKQYAYKVKPPSHHTKPDCYRLLSNFFNYKIPDEIKNRGEEEIEAFRKWCEKNKHLMDESENLFFNEMKLMFGSDIKLDAVNYKNSGANVKENLNLETIEKNIEDLISNANSFYIKDLKNKAILDNFGKSSFIWKKKEAPRKNNTEYSNEEIWKVLKDFEDKYKKPIIEYLYEYYKVKFNPELEFEGHLLEQLGFEACRQCQTI